VSRKRRETYGAISKKWRKGRQKKEVGGVLKKESAGVRNGKRTEKEKKKDGWLHAAKKMG